MEKKVMVLVNGEVVSRDNVFENDDMEDAFIELFKREFDDIPFGLEPEGFIYWCSLADPDFTIVDFEGLDKEAMNELKVLEYIIKHGGVLEEKYVIEAQEFVDNLVNDKKEGV